MCAQLALTGIGNELLRASFSTVCLSARWDNQIHPHISKSSHQIVLGTCRNGRRRMHMWTFVHRYERLANGFCVRGFMERFIKIFHSIVWKLAWDAGWRMKETDNGVLLSRKLEDTLTYATVSKNVGNRSSVYWQCGDEFSLGSFVVMELEWPWWSYTPRYFK